MKNFTKNNKSAFSLIELAVVIMVIGILVAGISQASSIIRNARISNARSITSKSPANQTSGLVAWYETSFIESFNPSQNFNNAQITLWQDISPSSLLAKTNQLTASASDNIKYKSNGINDIPTVNFTGSARLNLSAFTQGSLSQATIFIVINPNYVTDTSNYKTLIDGNTSTFSLSIKQDGVALNAGTNGTSTAVSNSFVYNAPKIICAYFNSTLSQAFLNNTSSNLGNAQFNSGTNFLSGLSVGSNFSVGNGFIGDISEIIIFNRVLKTGERREIYNYLAKKYKIEVTGI